MPAQNSPVWPGPALLVPITLDALLVGTGNQVAGALWAQTGIDYGALTQLYAGVTPFQQKNAPPVGAHLLWTLPYAIRRGNQDEGGSVHFHFAPNRWAILRTFVASEQGGPGTTAPLLSAGILRSDALHELGEHDSPYPNQGGVSGIGDFVKLEMWDGSIPGPAFLRAPGPGDVSWSAAYDNIRNVFAFHDDLTNLADGYCSYQVIGWYADPTDDPLSSTKTDWLTLMGQLGWGVGQDQEHALPASAITAAQKAWQTWQTAHGLSGATFNAGAIDPTTVPGQLAALMTKWGAYYAANGVAPASAAQLTLPAQTLCHGAVLGLHWIKANWGYPSGAPTQNTTVSVGNTPAEAVAAWMANWIRQRGGPTNVRDIETALEAFQKGLIFDLAKQPVETAASLQAGRFTGRDGGSHWVVVRVEQPADQAKATGSGNATIPLTPPQIAALRALNDAQSAADAATREVQAIEFELWSLYYKRWYLEGSSPAIDNAVLTLVGANAVKQQGPIAGLLGQAQATAATSATAATAALASLRGLLTPQGATPAFVVKEINNPSFSQPVDPVVLVAGSRGDTKHAPPGTYGSDGFTFTRFTGQTLRSLTITQSTGPANAIRLGAADLQAALLFPAAGASPSALGVPKELADLWIEALLVDGSCSAWLATLYLEKYQAAYPAAPQPALSDVTKLIRTQQTALWNDAATLGVAIGAIAATAQFEGTPPNPVAFEDGSTQPWSPLYIDWELEWHPSATGAGLGAEWQLAGLDYQWTGAQVPPSTLMYRGRTSVDPLASQNIARQLESFVSSDPDYDTLPRSIRSDLDQVKNQIQRFDFVTQSFSGVTEQWLTRLSAASMPVPPSYFGASINPGVPQIVQNAQGIQPVVQTPDGASPPYFPIRAGHFRITRLWVVDAWGQVLSPKHTDDDCVHFSAVSSLQTPGAANGDYVQVPPRFSQTARLNYTMIDANDDALASTSADATSPICGWVMSNHLDDSLMVYDATGHNLGSVIVIEKDAGQTGLRWDAAPGSSRPLGAAPDIANPHLSSFIGALLLAGANGSDAMRELLDVLDAASWKPQTLGQATGGQGNLALLAGRPYAVVRSRLDMELFGDPMLAVTQDLTQTGNFYPPAAPPAFTATAFSVQVGNENFATNTAVGYFIGDDYGTFHAVSASPMSTSALRRHLARGGPARQVLAQLGAPVAQTSYVVPSRPLSLAPKQPSGKNAALFLTVLVDPAGRIPVVSGSFPVLYGDLPPGPVATALDQMNISFRVGPLLLDPDQIKMPLPSAMHGDWAWMERESVTHWAPPREPAPSTPIPALANVPLRLREGWLVLSKSQEPS